LVVQEATGLLFSNTKGSRTSSDAFCLLRLRDLEARTKVIRITSNPKWQQTFRLPIETLKDELKVEVYHDFKYSEPILLGAARLCVADYDTYRGKHGTHTIWLHGEVPASITLHLEFEKF